MTNLFSMIDYMIELIYNLISLSVCVVIRIKITLRKKNWDNLSAFCDDTVSLEWAAPLVGSRQSTLDSASAVDRPKKNVFCFLVLAVR